MKLFISADIEGISGVTSNEHQSPQGSQYADARRWMTGDVNAAIEGAIEAGVAEVLVKDAHGPALNILPDELDERATLIQGWGPQDSMMEGLTDEFDLVFLVGYHPMAGTPDGVLAHTWSGALRSLTIAGVGLGEMGISALFAGAHEVPVGLVSTCEAGKRQGKELLPWAEVVAVKRGITRYAAELLPTKRAQELIREAATRAVERIEELKPLVYEGPYEMRTTWANTGIAQACATMDGVGAVDAYTTEVVCDTALEALRKLRQLFKVAHSSG